MAMPLPSIPAALIQPGVGVGNLQLGVTTLDDVRKAFEKTSKPFEFNDGSVSLSYWQYEGEPAEDDEEEEDENSAPWLCGSCLFEEGVLSNWEVVGWNFPLKTAGGTTRGSTRADVIAEFGPDGHSVIAGDEETLYYWSLGIAFAFDEDQRVSKICLFPPDRRFARLPRVLEPFVGIGQVRLGESTVQDVLAVYGEDAETVTDDKVEYANYNYISGVDYVRPDDFEFTDGRLTGITVRRDSLLRTPGGVGPGTPETELGREFPSTFSTVRETRFYDGIGGLQAMVDDGNVAVLSLEMPTATDDARAWDHGWDDPAQATPAPKLQPPTPDLLSLFTALDWSGYFARAAPGFRERVLDEFLRGAFYSLFDESCGRVVRADGEDLAEYGIAPVLRKLEPFLRGQGCPPLTIDTLENKGSYALRVNGRRFDIYSEEDVTSGAHFWRMACERTADIVNWQLAMAGSSERAFHSGGPDNPHNLLLLTFDQFLLLRDTRAPIPRWQRPYRSDELEAWTMDFLNRR